jgi:ornithine cyclodeaminase/alanine dehydrogenase-like protein (mu-crystallin family)
MDLVAETAGRKNSAERHIVINLGLALEDVATANMLYRRALDLGVGTVLPS